MARISGVPFKYGRRVCIFCDGESESRISEEHIWPKWAADMLPGGTMHGIVAGKADRKDLTYTGHRSDQRQGAVTNFRIKHVCQACNSGWMGSYEEQVRPFLEPMMLGQQAHLDEGERRLLVEYLSYKMMILDAGFPDQFIPPEVARSFYAERALPAGMDMHILNCVEGNWRIGIRLIGGAFSQEMSDPKMPPNVKSFAVGFGNLFVYAVIRKEGEFDFNFDPGVSIQLWPPKHPSLRWPTLVPIDSNQAEFIAMSIWRASNSPDVMDITHIPGFPDFGKV